jgi:hypothetical protein
MTQYLLLLHERPADAADDTGRDEEMVPLQGLVAAQLAEAGKLVDGWKLTDDGGRALRLQGGRAGGQRRPLRRGAGRGRRLFIVNAESDDPRPTALAQTCPHLSGRSGSRSAASRSRRWMSSAPC